MEKPPLTLFDWQQPVYVSESSIRRCLLRFIYGSALLCFIRLPAHTQQIRADKYRAGNWTQARQIKQSKCQSLWSETLLMTISRANKQIWHLFKHFKMVRRTLSLNNREKDRKDTGRRTGGRTKRERHAHSKLPHEASAGRAQRKNREKWKKHSTDRDKESATDEIPARSTREQREQRAGLTSRRRPPGLHWPRWSQGCSTGHGNKSQGGGGGLGQSSTPLQSHNKTKKKKRFYLQKIGGKTVVGGGQIWPIGFLIQAKTIVVEPFWLRLLCLCSVLLSFSSEPLDGALQKLFILPVFVFFTHFFSGHPVK